MSQIGKGQALRETVIALVDHIETLGGGRQAKHLRKCLFISLDQENVIYDSSLDPEAKAVDKELFVEAYRDVQASTQAQLH